MNQLRYPLPSPQITDPDLLRIAIWGAGPTGLEAALYARYLGFPVWIFDGRVLGESPGPEKMTWAGDAPWSECTSPLGRAALAAQQQDQPLPTDQQVVSWLDYRDAYYRPLAASDLLSESWKEGHQLVAAELESSVAKEADLAVISESIEPGEMVMLTDDDSETGWPTITQPYAVSFADREWKASAWRLTFNTSQGAVTHWFDWVIACQACDHVQPDGDSRRAEHGWFDLGPARSGAADDRLGEGLEHIRELFAWLGGRAELDLYRSFGQ